LLAAGLAVLSAASNLLLSAAELAVRGGGRARYHSTIITGVTGTLLQCALQLLFLPYLAFVGLHAALTAQYRLHVSRKNLLRWVTAAESEHRAGQGVWSYARKMMPGQFICPTCWKIFWRGSRQKVVKAIG
jgi:cyclic beta-1,2-glucan synthetase